VNTIKVPEGIDWAAVSKDAMDSYQVEVAGGLGPSVGKVWRVGLMGVSGALLMHMCVLWPEHHCACRWTCRGCM
jgi:aspartate aminotransferase-like enzyme